MMRLAFDGQPVWFVNPESVDLPAIKHKAALQGVNVVASRVIPPGQAFAAPRGIPRPEE